VVEGAGPVHSPLLEPREVHDELGGHVGQRLAEASLLRL